MSNTTDKPTERQKGLVVMGNRLNMDPVKMHQVLKNSYFKGSTDEEMMVLVMVANQYNLNPFLKQIYAFPDKRGGIVPVVSIDGWASIINDNKNRNGVKFDYVMGPDNKPISCTCTMFIKGQDHPTVVTEYYSECFRATEPWKGMPCRMLRHKAYMQCGRLAFGLGGIYDEDEARDIVSGPTINIESHVVKEPALIPGVAEQDDVPMEASAPKKDPAAKSPVVKRKLPVRKQPDPEPDPEPPVEEAPPVDDEPPVEEEAPAEEPAPAPTPRRAPGSEKANADSIRELNKLMVEADVTEDQVLIFCLDTGNMNDGAVAIEDLTTKQVLTLLKTWKTILPQIKAIVV